ncbi:phage tail tip lysozyme [Paracoccus sp. DMF]|uniref:phage tail tip lysozyme n=1 Tax=Paracoccus sp. DMF TaxID=400837 RepID=UPI00110196A8|nr:phage tail tip lysozyme [Paracoccus sp. DMF]MCV2448890.1 phage tail tip lysozyme [Paracoccus sp. DMF]
MAANALSPDYLYSGLIERGIAPHIAQAFVVNAQDESGLNPGINEAAPIVPGSRGGYGLMQWTGPRRRALEAYAAQHGQSVADADTQMDYLLTELQGPESRAWSRIQSTQTPEQAAAAIVNDFLRPAESHRASRERNYLAGVTFNPDNAGRAYTPASEGMDAQGQRTNALDPAMFAALAQSMQRQPELPQFQMAEITPYQMQGTQNALAPQYSISPLAPRFR